MAQRPDYDAPVLGDGRVVDTPGRQRGAWTEEEVIDAMVEFLASRGARGRDTLRAYQDWSSGVSGAPSSSRLKRFGGFAAVRAAARLKLRTTRPREA